MPCAARAVWSETRPAAHSSLSAAISPWIRSSFFALLHVSVYDFQASRQVERSRSFHVRRIRFAIFSLWRPVVEVVVVAWRRREEDEVEVERWW